MLTTDVSAGNHRIAKLAPLPRRKLSTLSRLWETSVANYL